MVEIREVRLWELEPSSGLQTLKGGEFRLTATIRVQVIQIAYKYTPMCLRLQLGSLVLCNMHINSIANNMEAR